MTQTPPRGSVAFETQVSLLTRNGGWARGSGAAVGVGLPPDANVPLGIVPANQRVINGSEVQWTNTFVQWAFGAVEFQGTNADTGWVFARVFPCPRHRIAERHPGAFGLNSDAHLGRATLVSAGVDD